MTFYNEVRAVIMCYCGGTKLEKMQLFTTFYLNIPECANIQQPYLE